MVDIREINGSISIGLLDLDSFSRWRNISVKREQEKSGTLFLLDQLVKNGSSRLSYTPENKPFLAGDEIHISISHSHDKLAIITSRSHSTGIDIELIRDKVLKIRHKFLNAEETDFAGSDLCKLITIWSAKEAMYKAYGMKGVDFKTDLEVKPFAGSTLEGAIKIKSLQKKYRMNSEQIGEYIMVYIADEI